MSHRRSDYESDLKLLIAERKWLEKFLSGFTCCAVCFDNNHLVLEEHHIAGRKNSDSTITVCADHHTILSRMQRSWPKVWTSTNNDPIVREALLCKGLSDLLKVKSDYLFERAE